MTTICLLIYTTIHLSIFLLLRYKEDKNRKGDEHLKFNPSQFPGNKIFYSY